MSEAAVDPAKTDWQGYQPTGNKREVYRFLVAAGWRVAERTFYRHIEQGKLRRHKDGTFHTAAVRKYALAWCLHGGVGEQLLNERSGSDDDLATQKLRAEVDRLRIALVADQHKLDIAQGRYIARDQVERELAGRAAVIAAGYDHMVYSRAAEMVALVGGEPARIEMLIEALLAAKDEWLAAYAEPGEWQVEWVE